VRLSSLRIVGLPPFGDVEIPFADESGAPRSVTVLFGGGGVGKTTVLGAIANTRPGYAVALAGHGSQPPYVVSDWTLGIDDPTRPHHLRIATPTAKLEADEQAELVRRREQAHFDRVAKDGGFVFVAIPSTRWFGRQPIAMAAPGRTVARYDVRAPVALDDASRTDLARETKQSLAYAAVTAALSRDRGGAAFVRLGETMARTVDTLVALTGYSYAGLDVGGLEPLFRSDDGQVTPFDALPTRARHLVAIGALTVRALWGAYPMRDPLEAEGVVAIDEIELQQDASVLGSLLDCLRNALPRVQWIVTTTSPVVAASAAEREVFALRRLPRAPEVQLFSGAEARVH
jgi:hypothetical protein